MPTWENPDWRAGMVAQYSAEAILRFAVEEWEGVGDEDGNPLAPSPEAFAAFAAHPDATRALMAIAVEEAEAVAAEGNASAPSSPGAGGEGANTAPDAATGAPPAR